MNKAELRDYIANNHDITIDQVPLEILRGLRTLARESEPDFAELMLLGLRLNQERGGGYPLSDSRAIRRYICGARVKLLLGLAYRQSADLAKVPFFKVVEQADHAALAECELLAFGQSTFPSHRVIHSQWGVA